MVDSELILGFEYDFRHAANNLTANVENIDCDYLFCLLY